jgi:hypothetical protein
MRTLVPGGILDHFLPSLSHPAQRPNWVWGGSRGIRKKVPVQVEGRIYQKVNLLGQMGLGKGCHFIRKGKIMVARDKEYVAEAKGVQPLDPPAVLLTVPS